jgi:phosphoglycerate dehydrogenase-like enzyme
MMGEVRCIYNREHQDTYKIHTKHNIESVCAVRALSAYIVEGNGVAIEQDLLNAMDTGKCMAEMMLSVDNIDMEALRVRKQMDKHKGRKRTQRN